MLWHTLSMGTPLARNTDPHTSKKSAEQVRKALTSNHLSVLRVLRDEGPLTDDQLADKMYRLGVGRRHEQARRWIRTCREEYGLIDPALDPETNEQGTSTNASGREALLWRISDIGKATLEHKPAE